MEPDIDEMGFIIDEGMEGYHIDGMQDAHDPIRRP